MSYKVGDRQVNVSMEYVLSHIEFDYLYDKETITTRKRVVEYDLDTDEVLSEEIVDDEYERPIYDRVRITDKDADIQAFWDKYGHDISVYDVNRGYSIMKCSLDFKDYQHQIEIDGDDPIIAMAFKVAKEMSKVKGDVRLSKIPNAVFRKQISSVATKEGA